VSPSTTSANAVALRRGPGALRVRERHRGGAPPPAPRPPCGSRRESGTDRVEDGVVTGPGERQITAGEFLAEERETCPEGFAAACGAAWSPRNPAPGLTYGVQGAKS
jgi:hypothetical protein